MRICILSTDVFLHTPNLLVASIACTDCINTFSSYSFCGSCGSQESVFSSEDPVSNLGFKFITCIAHNAKGYDSNFILVSALENTNWKPDVIMPGSKILSIVFSSGHLRFIDSLNFLPMTLSKLPSALGLEGSLGKGYFPHFFNTSRNSNYVGKLPPVHTYGVDLMTTIERESFL
ncbi:hypothetical protein J437_LFUL001258 [Ladona fulva]|uniref:DNA-directed DNA polymerase n=1 Tax=Ladona fulva TaxID=123851 RepID=A0A8K0JT09_LADFU|nr:hypothetical protein J437_LFUL001258 [Ladona fulva]